MRLLRPLLAVIATGALTAGSCQAPSVNRTSPSVNRTSPSVNRTPAVTTPAHCHATGTTPATVLPDPVCTPGEINPTVTQANIATTICKTGWTATVRPPVSYTDRLKIEQIAAYGDYAGMSPKGYEEDHRVPLEVGGAPSDPRNLWPEQGPTPNPKDRIENYIHSRVCSGLMTLAAGQAVFLGDYWKLG